MSRVLITGITGYTGSHLARRLLGTHQVFGLVRQPVQTRYLEGIRKQVTLLYSDGSGESLDRALEAARPDLIYHLAAYYTTDHRPEAASRLLSSNVVLGARLLTAMVSHGCRRLVFADSVTGYAADGNYLPRTLYAATKRAFRDMAAYYIRTGLVQMTTLVLADSYGPGDGRSKVLNLLKRAAAARETLALSPGGQDYDLVYIDDVAEAFALAGARLLSDTERDSACYQVFPQRPLTLRQTVETLERVTGVTCPAAWGARPSPPGEDARAIRIFPPVPGWRARISLEEGLRRFWREDGL